MVAAGPASPGGLEGEDPPVEQQLVQASVDEQRGVPGLAADPGARGDAGHGAPLMHHQSLGFGQLPWNDGGRGGTSKRLCAGMVAARIPQMQAWGWPTCGHVEEEGENTATVIACPEQPARGIEGQSEDPACQLAGAPLHFLARGDVHDVHVVLGIPHLSGRPSTPHTAFSPSLLGSDHDRAAVDGTGWFLLESNPGAAAAGRLGGDRGL